MVKSQGFTLIELIIVIIILGVLSVTAAPKFLNLSSDANIAALNGLKGAMSSTSSIIQLKAVIEGINFGDGSAEANPALIIDGQAIAMRGNYLSPSWGRAWFHVLETNETNSGFSQPGISCDRDVCAAGGQNPTSAQLSGIDATSIPNFSNDGRFLILWFNGFRVPDNCYVYYFHPQANFSAPTFGTVNSGC